MNSLTDAPRRSSKWVMRAAHALLRELLLRFITKEDSKLVKYSIHLTEEEILSTSRLEPAR